LTLIFLILDLHKFCCRYGWRQHGGVVVGYRHSRCELGGLRREHSPYLCCIIR